MAMQPDGMTIIEEYPTGDAAQSQAAYLVEHGVGATVDSDAGGQHRLAVLDDDAERARELLGLVEVEREDLDESQLIAVNRPWLIPVLLIGLALFAVPVIAFFIAFKITGG